MIEDICNRGLWGNGLNSVFKECRSLSLDRKKAIEYSTTQRGRAAEQP